MGNLNPGSNVALTLKYVQELPLEADGALRYVLPAVLNPRYRGSGESPFFSNPGSGWYNLGSPLKVVGVLRSVGRENRTKVTFCRII